MKTTSIKSASIITLIIMLLAYNFVTAQEASKTIRKTFTVNKDALLKVDNRFGKIHCNVWDKNEINIEVVIKAVASDTREAERMLERISVDISGNASRVDAVTTLSGKSSNGSKSQMIIDYTISMPRTINLELINKFGDIYVDENSGNSSISLDYGNLQVNTLKGNNQQINLRFSKGILGKAEKLSLEMSYSELRSDEIKDLVIDSKFSTFEIQNAGSIRQESQYDTNHLGNLESVKAVAMFSTINIGSVKEHLELEVKYGGCTVREVGPQFRVININNSFGNVDIRFDPEVSYKLDAESSFGNVVFPKSATVDVEETSFTGKTYRGIVGKDAKTARKVVIVTKNGDVNLKTK